MNANSQSYHNPISDDQQTVAARIRAEIAETRHEVAEIQPQPPVDAPVSRHFWYLIGRVEALADVLVWMDEPFYPKQDGGAS